MDLNEQPDPDKTPAATPASARRRLVAGIGLGSAAGVAGMLPARWTKPVVDSILLPAHAQATQPGPDPQPDPGPTCPDLPDVRTESGLGTAFGLGDGVTASVNVNPDDFTYEFSNGAPSAGYLLAFGVTNLANNDIDPVVGSEFSLVGNVSRTTRISDPEVDVVRATVEHAASCSQYQISLAVRIAGSVNVEEAGITGPTPV